MLSDGMLTLLKPNAYRGDYVKLSLVNTKFDPIWT